MFYYGHKLARLYKTSLHSIYLAACCRRFLASGSLRQTGFARLLYLHGLAVRGEVGKGGGGSGGGSSQIIEPQIRACGQLCGPQQQPLRHVLVFLCIVTLS